VNVCCALAALAAAAGWVVIGCRAEQEVAVTPSPASVQPAVVEEQTPVQATPTVEPLSQRPAAQQALDTQAVLTDVPPGYQGPIDPQWPPSHPADLEVELRAARILRGIMRRGERPPRESLIAGDTPGVFAEQGRIGGFDYIEVVLGPITSPDERMPLVVLLHGRGGRPTIPEGPYLGKRPLRLFIPRGPDHLQGGYNWLATWTMSGKVELLSRSLAGRVDQLMPAIEAFAALRPTLGKPIVAGFSQGGILTFALATRYPAFFAAALPIAGWLPPGMVPTVRAPGVSYPFIHAFHGGDDHVVPTEMGRKTVAELRSAGITVEYSEFPGVGHEVTPEISHDVKEAVRTLFSQQ